MFKLKKKENAKEIVVNQLNYDFFNKITSHSLYSFHELYYIHANKYFTCLQLFDFPKYSTNDFLGAFSGDEDVTLTIDCEHLNRSEYITMFDKNIRFGSDDVDNTKSFRKSNDKVEELQELNEFDRYLNHTNEQAKLITVRIYICANTLEALQEKLDSIVMTLIGKKMKGYVQTNDLESDVQAITDFSNPVKRLVASSSVADMLLKTEISKVQYGGVLLGYTKNGLFCPDIFSFDNYSYNYIAMGGMGAGKSALLKVLEEGAFVNGNHTIHIFDIHGEYNLIANKLGIPIVEINGDKTVNVCQIPYTVDKSGIIEDVDISSRVAVLTETLKTITQESRIDVINQFEVEATRIYKEKYLGKKLIDVTNKEWLLFSDIRELIYDKFANNKFLEEARNDIYRLILSLDKLIESYGYIYNQYTTMEFDLEQSLVFDLSYFKEVKDNRVKSAYVSLLMDYVSKAVSINLDKNNKSLGESKTTMNKLKRPIHTYRLLVDETMQYAEDTGFLLKCINLMKYMRKAYAGVGFVIHTLDDTRKQLESAQDSQSYLGQLFGLCTHKFIGKVDGASLNDLPNIVKAMNEDDKNIVAEFDKGIHGEREFLSINEDRREKFYFTSIVNSFQQDYFGGGV